MSLDCAQTQGRPVDQKGRRKAPLNLPLKGEGEGEGQGEGGVEVVRTGEGNGEGEGEGDGEEAGEGEGEAECTASERPVRCPRRWSGPGGSGAEVVWSLMRWRALDRWGSGLVG